MAFRRTNRRTTSTRTRSRRTVSRRRAPARRTTARRSTRRSASPRTIRIVIEQPSSANVGVPVIGQKIDTSVSKRSQF